MTAKQTAPQVARPRGSAHLLACWETGAARGGPLDGVAESLTAAGGTSTEHDRWGRVLRRHGARPSRPQALTDGVPLTELVRNAPVPVAVAAAREAAHRAANGAARV